MRTEPSEAMAETLKTRQGWAGRLLDLAEFLGPTDRALIRGIYRLGMTATDFARAVDQHPRSMRLRVRRIIERMTSTTYKRVATQYQRWSHPRRRIAEAVFLHGLTQREASKRLGVSIYRIRRESDVIRALVEGHITAEAEQRERSVPHATRRPSSHATSFAGSAR